MRLVADILARAPASINPCGDFELDLRGLRIPQIENLALTEVRNLSLLFMATGWALYLLALGVVCVCMQRMEYSQHCPSCLPGLSTLPVYPPSAPRCASTNTPPPYPPHASYTPHPTRRTYTMLLT